MAFKAAQTSDHTQLNTGEPGSVASTLAAVIRRAIDSAGGWWPFDAFMAAALYQPGLGYYASHRQLFGCMPASGSDFVTAPELSPLFARALAAAVAQALAASGSRQVMEFGAGSGALAAGLLDALDGLGLAVTGYAIVDVSGTLRQRQQARLARFGDRVQWLDALPEAFDGVLIGNEVLDAMPVQLLHFDGVQWFERGVVAATADTADAADAAAAANRADRADAADGAGGFAWSDRPTALRPPVDAAHLAQFVPGTTVEIHAQAEAFIRTVAGMLRRGVAFFIDYGFPEAEFYLPQRHGGTLMCHQAHRADGDPLVAVGQKDITAHINFTGIALAAQGAGAAVIGYTSQARFLLNCGWVGLLESASLAERSMAQRLIHEHEMGELFKVIAFSRGLAGGELAGGELAGNELAGSELAGSELAAPLGFAHGDRTHRL